MTDIRKSAAALRGQPPLLYHLRKQGFWRRTARWEFRGHDRLNIRHMMLSKRPADKEDCVAVERDLACQDRNMLK